MDNISQIISRSIGGYSIGSILSALLTPSAMYLREAIVWNNLKFTA